MEERRKNPQPLTQEQLEWITEQTKRAALKSAKQAAIDSAKHVQRRALIGFLVLLVGLVVVQFISSSASEAEREAIVQSGQVVAIDACNRDYAEDVRIRDVFIASKISAQTRIDNGESENVAVDRRAIRFYDEQLRIFELPDCRKAEDLLTSDPDKFLPLVEPYYEGSLVAPSSAFTGSPG